MIPNANGNSVNPHDMVAEAPSLKRRSGMHYTERNGMFTPVRSRLTGLLIARRRRHRHSRAGSSSGWRLSRGSCRNCIAPSSVSGGLSTTAFYFTSLLSGDKKTKYQPGSSAEQFASFLRLCDISLVIFCLTAIIAIIFLVSACCARYFLNNRDFDKKC